MNSNAFESNPVYGDVEEIIDEVAKKFKKFDIVAITTFWTTRGLFVRTCWPIKSSKNGGRWR